MDKKISDKEILDVYVETKNYKKVTAETGASYLKIKRILIENGLFRQQFLGGGRKKEFYFNEDYFEKIDTIDKAYWMGFIWGDGFITNNSSAVGVSLSSVDYSHLEKLSTSLNFNGNIHTYDILSGFKTHNGDGTPTQYSRIIFNSKKLVGDLKNHGLQEKKSLSMLPPNKEAVPSYLMPHFLRGLQDANGSICRASNNDVKKGYYLHILGTESILKLFKDEMCLKTSQKPYQRKTGCPVYSLRFNLNKQNIWMLDLLYEGSCSANRLNRKHSIYLEIKKMIDNV